MEKDNVDSNVHKSTENNDSTQSSSTNTYSNKMLEYINNFSKEFDKRYNYIKNRDKDTIDSLEDEQEITFVNESDPEQLATHEYYDKEYTGISYDKFMNKTYKLQDPDTIVLPCSYINLYFDNPNWDEHITFKIKADDELKGFTRHEIMKKALDRFHLLYYIYKNYSVDDRKINPENSSHLFGAALHGDNEYEANGLHFIIYNTKYNYWRFECMVNH